MYGSYTRSRTQNGRGMGLASAKKGRTESSSRLYVLVSSIQKKNDELLLSRSFKLFQTLSEHLIHNETRNDKICHHW
jgi:hypothetical protein